MENYCNFKSTILLKESSLVKDSKSLDFSVIAKVNDTNAKMASFKIFVDNKKYSIEYLVLACPAVFVKH